MSQSVGESMYAGRKIRTAASDVQVDNNAPSTRVKQIINKEPNTTIKQVNSIASNTNVNPINNAVPNTIVRNRIDFDSLPEGAITFGEAASKGFLKPGMAVVFRDCNFGPVSFSYEETGKEQKITFCFSKGVVLKKANGTYSIFTILQIPTIQNRNPNRALMFVGRYGRANIEKVIRKFIDDCTADILGRPKATLIETEDFVKYSYDCPLVFDYFLKENCYEGSCIFGYSNDLRSVGIYNFSEEYLRVGTGESTHKVHNIAILLEGNNLVCTFKKGTPKTTREGFSYCNNPYENCIEIRGVSND